MCHFVFNFLIVVTFLCSIYIFYILILKWFKKQMVDRHVHLFFIAIRSLFIFIFWVEKKVHTTMR